MKLFSFFLTIPLVFATLGVDISSSVDQFTCMENQGYKFAIIRGYRSYGAVDAHVVQNIKNAKNAGMEDAGVYLFPCVPCKNAKN